MGAGKTKYIKTPEKFKELLEQYIKHTKANPRKVEVFGGKDFAMRKQNLEVPLTLSGFENFVAKIDGMPLDLGDYFENRNKAYGDYSAICSYAKRVFRQDQIEGGMVGQYNPSITQRLNGLTDKKEQTIIAEQPLFGEDKED